MVTKQDTTTSHHPNTSLHSFGIRLALLRSCRDSFISVAMFFTGTLQEALASAVQSNKSVVCFVTGGYLPCLAGGSDATAQHTSVTDRAHR